MESLITDSLLFLRKVEHHGMYYVGTVPCNPSDEIRHYGRKGMKWYEHIFTNPDGSPKTNSEVSQDIKTFGKAAGNVNTAFDSAGKIAGRAGSRAKPSKKVQKELSSMSDDELRKRVNRMNLEQQYRNLTGDNTRKGAKVAADVIGTIGDVAKIVTGVAGTIIVIEKLRRGDVG